MGPLSNTFRKTERLCSRKIITSLFENGNSIYTSNFRVVWNFTPNTFSEPAQVMFSVAKKNFKKAVHRNLIKRRLRESYRKQKHSLYAYLNEAGLQISFIVIYRNSTIPEYAFTEAAVREMLDSLTDSVKRKAKNC